VGFLIEGVICSTAPLEQAKRIVVIRYLIKYLLTGFRSLSLALAGHFGLELYLCHLPSIPDDCELERLFSTLPPRCIVLLEDIDAVGTKRRGRFDGPPGKDDDEGHVNGDESDENDDDSYTSRSRCSLSGLLNVLDGVTSQEGRIVLMTSNMAEKLDKALIRPGRIDKMVFLGHISKKSAENMFLRMYTPHDSDPSNQSQTSPKVLQELSLAFSNHIPDTVFTPAEVCSFVFIFRMKYPV
jgi:chaperone BCS1